MAQPNGQIDTLAADLSQAEPAEVARLVAQAPDALLAEVLGGAGRGPVLDEVFRRFPDYANTERTAGVNAAIAFVITGGAGAPDRFLVVFEEGTCHAGRDLPGSPRVTFELDAVDFLKLVTGNADAPVMFLTGRLRVSGDELFAIAVGGFFRVPTASVNGSGDATSEIVPVDVDPAALARAIAGTPDKDLRAGMRGALRDVVLEEIFRRFPEYLDADRTRGVDAAVKWKITGRADGGADRYTLLLRDGACRIEKDAEAKPRVTITMDGADFLKLVTGNANPPLMFLRGRLKVAGDLAFAARLAAFFRIPSAAPR